MSRLVRCEDCHNLIGAKTACRPTCALGLHTRSRYARRRCEGFRWATWILPSHGFVVQEGHPLRLYDGQRWIEVERPRFMAPNVGRSFH
ncbi:hypothetical protein ThidrDRAFT_4100 [Thiorhodococcus drewsii AZ1]|uniref:Uncharacterized protein n=1 Tax=Thiorhodococcus drewsii AZ1 TaxID=765913 RepID=G2E737_9GAMM|nr:hypothetical protein [Thiorhodococcus drewsii]EGV28068.1 hypothetical protein ThidrDRAFT_4100 [Thiorhodococcus drewsii AZ1]